MLEKVRINTEGVTKKIFGIQYLRGIAAILVVMSHVNGMSSFPKYFSVPIFKGRLSSASNHVDLGIEGVYLFFVISGFIMTYTSLAPSTLLPRIATFPFLRKRVVRILPFMWFAILLFAVVRFLTLKIFPIENYLRALFLFPIGALEPKQIWTLRHEFLFYSIFCLTLISFKKLKPLLYLWFLSPIFITAIELKLTSNSLGSFLFSKYNILFGLGYIAGVIHLKGYWPRQWKTNLLFSICIILILFELVCIHFLKQTAESDGLLHLFTSGAICAIVLLTTNALTIEKDSSLHKIALLIGDASYSIYLTHGIFIAGVLKIWSSIQPQPHPLLILVVVSLICIIAGIIFHIFVEKPLTQNISLRLRKEKNSR
ncbi:acyltransferase family protein [Desertivirga xinjiangensis]|uniref:acyltransferase family protein n=1 Tax=Desertivirga xinjiangensis TaxID=539206 RepID=UPI00210DEF96|nr:acyltransferase [Pedobacter xinjiangensis]